MKTITVITVVNNNNKTRGEKLVENIANKINFLSPKTKVIDNCNSYNDYINYRIKYSSDWFDTDFALFVEFDSTIINENAWNDDFFNYDCIGAPWLAYDFIRKNYYRHPGDRNMLVGNGGFTLRSKKLCDIIKEKYAALTPVHENEDVFVCQNKRDELESLGIKFAPYEIANKFAVENQKYDGQFGVHHGLYYNDKYYNLKTMSDEEILKLSGIMHEEN